MIISFSNKSYKGKMNTCALCAEKYCDSGELDKIPANCPCKDEEYVAKAKDAYKEPVDFKLARCSAMLEKEGYCQKTRVEETIDFAKMCGFKTLGLAFCVGFSREAAILIKILKHHGFSVESTVCKNGSIPKEFLDLTEEYKLTPGAFEPMCNPIGQAILLNRAKTDFNIVLGLCIGHDSLFIKHAEAPVTVLAVKDRVLAHNPMAALYLSEGYYKEKLYK